MIKGMVSCLMVTKVGREDMARRAVECFTRQTYANRELVIVSDEPGYWREGLPGIAAGRCFLGPIGLLGDMRNFAVARAEGEYVAQWDDDDWHHPDRLTAQVENLQQYGNEFDACTLARWTVYDSVKNRAVISSYRPRGWEGSIVARRWKLPCYPSLARGEDTPVVDSLRVAMIDRPELYIYHHHGRNTFPPAHFDGIFSHATDRADLSSTVQKVTGK